MSLVSIEFALFFIIFFGIYWCFTKHVYIQNILLILAGMGFILSWQWYFLINIFLVWLIAECALLALFKIEKPNTPYHLFASKIDTDAKPSEEGEVIFVEKRQQRRKKRVLGFFISLLVLQLFLYKYLNFSIGQYNQFASASHEITPLNILLPLGISFYTFQAISYIVDVYHGKSERMPLLVSFGVFSSFFTITAGPIFRPIHASPQWQNPREILLPFIAMTFILMALFKKIVLAGWLGDVWVSPIFADPLQFHPLEVITGVYGYSLQLFFDFSGYTDLAIGLGLLLGFRLPINFNTPYLAKNIRDFWQRWHISLSHWIRDYLYIPLGGNRQSWMRTQVNLMLAFVISGMWHGAGWNFFIWGAIHGIGLVWLNVMKKYRILPNLGTKYPWLVIFITFHYVTFAWIFFHSTSLTQVQDIFSAMININDSNDISLPVTVTLVMMLVGWLSYPYLAKLPNIIAEKLEIMPWWLLPLPISLFVMLIFSLAPAGLPGFIYANF